MKKFVIGMLMVMAVIMTGCDHYVTYEVCGETYEVDDGELVLTETVTAENTVVEEIKTENMIYDADGNVIATKEQHDESERIWEKCVSGDHSECKIVVVNKADYKCGEGLCEVHIYTDAMNGKYPTYFTTIDC